MTDEKYIVMIGRNVHHLAELVHDLMDEGFVPIGGVTYREKIPQGFAAEYYQALYKPELPERETVMVRGEKRLVSEFTDV